MTITYSCQKTSCSVASKVIGNGLNHLAELILNCLDSEEQKHITIHLLCITNDMSLSKKKQVNLSAYTELEKVWTSFLRVINKWLKIEEKDRFTVTLTVDIRDDN